MSKFVTVNGVNYNADHAKAIGKEAFCNSKELHHHHQHLPGDADRKKALEAVYDQIVAPVPAANPAASKLN